MFLSQSFPIENRPGLHDQDLSVFCRELAKLRPAEIHVGGAADPARAEARAALVRFLSDWHLVAFMGQAGILDADEMARLCKVATTHDSDAALDALLGSNGWQTLVTIASEYAEPERTRNESFTYDGQDSDQESLDAPYDNAPESPGGDGGAACPHCTFVNAPGETDCDVCGLPLR